MLTHHAAKIKLFILGVDIGTTAFSFLAAYGLRVVGTTYSSHIVPIDLSLHLSLLFIILPLWGFLLYWEYTDLYHRFTSFATECRIVLKTATLGMLLLVTIVFGLKLTWVSRTLLGLFYLCNILFLITEKVLLRRMIELLHAKGYNSKNLLIIGDGPETDNLIQTISECRGWGLTIIGRMGKEKERREKRERRTENEREVPILGSYGELRAVLHRYPVDEVIFNLTPEDVRELDELLTICREEGVAAHLVATSIPEGITPLRQETLHGIRLLPVTGFYRPVWQSAIKRGIDIVISAILLILLLPLFAVIALLIKLTSSGPIFYWWHVLGINKKPFIGYKFRTMIENADDLKPQLMDYNEMNGPAFKMRNDPRVTSFGRFLRKYSLDELPQLWSVLKGDMSLVGPHPPLQTEVEKFKDWHRRKLSVKPGITCFWQINGRHEIGDFDEWAGLDLQYIDNWSLWLDFKILLKTIPAVLKGTGV